MPDTMTDEGVTFWGQAPNQGRIVIGEHRPGEGYAVLKCGNTEVQISYTVLHRIDIQVSAYLSPIRDMEHLRKAVYAITAEASMGRTGDGCMTLASAARELGGAAIPLRRWAEKDLRSEQLRVSAMEQAEEPVRLAIERFDVAIAAIAAAIGEA